MYKSYDDDGNWKWIPFLDADCERRDIHTGEIYQMNVTGVWEIDELNGYSLPNQKQIDSVACKEYAACWKGYL